MLNQSFALILPLAVSLTAWGASPEPPRERVDTQLPAQTGNTLRVAGDCGDLQAKLDAARPGDTVLIPHGSTCTGNFKLSNKGTAPGWIVIQTTGLLPPPGHRIGPDQAPQLAKIVTANSSPAIWTEAGAHHYRLIGLEITSQVAPPAGVDDLVRFGDGSQAQKTIEAVPANLIVDRCYIHGSPHQRIKRGVALNSARTAVIDSYFSEIHVPGADSQALCGWNGPGPFRIENNFLSASTENIMFGGARGFIPDLVPSDIEIRRNHFYKPLSWKPDDPGFAGDEWSVKNLLEFKNARRVVVEGNIFEHIWSGFAILFTVRAERNSMPWNVVEDITVSTNLFRHSAGGMNLSAFDDESGNQGVTQRILFRNNVLEDTDRARWGGYGNTFQILHGPPDIQIDHNTIFQSGCIVLAGYSQPGVRFELKNNVGNGDICSASDKGIGMSALDYHFPGAVITKNVFAGARESSYPSGNFFPADVGSIAFANFAEGDYHLTSGPYKGAGTDGLDLGADIDAVAEAAAAALAGSPRIARPLVREPSNRKR
jgi:hypothetical protein